MFFFGMCVAPLVANPKRHFDAALSIACHVGLLLWLATGSLENMWLAGIIPCAISSAVGAYLFFAQHTFPGARLRTGREWDYIFAALNSSSYIRMSRLMCWFTGNIGYHHVHHLNSKIPFYRLPEAMAAIKELQAPVTTSLHPRDVLACLRLKLWDPISRTTRPLETKPPSAKRPVASGGLISAHRTAPLVRKAFVVDFLRIACTGSLGKTPFTSRLNRRRSSCIGRHPSVVQRFEMSLPAVSSVIEGTSECIDS